MATADYGAGRMGTLTNNVATKAYAYDALARVAANSQTMTGASPYTFSYSYNLADGLREVTYPAIGAQAGRKVGYEYYASGRLKGVWDGAVGSAQRWVQEDIAYWPSGAPKTTTLGNEVVEETGLDERLRQNVRKAGKAGVSLMALTVAYESNGNVSWENRQSAAPGQGISTTTYYSSDGVNRLANATPYGGAWSESNGYNRWGNRWVSAYSGYSPLFMVPTAGDQFGANNRLVNQQNETQLPGTPYDDAGNLQSHPQMGTMTYDGENRLVGATSGTPPRTSSYAYDGDGKRVARTVGGDATVYVYDAFGMVAAEAGAASTVADEVSDGGSSGVDAVGDGCGRSGSQVL